MPVPYTRDMDPRLSIAVVIALCLALVIAMYQVGVRVGRVACAKKMMRRRVAQSSSST